MSTVSYLNHKHVIFKAKLINPPKTALQVHRWLEAIVPEIGMEFFMGPYCQRSELEGNVGITGIAVITTSHIALHTFEVGDGSAELQLDVYSCKCFDKRVVMESLELLYGAQDWEVLELDRNNHLKIEGKSQEIGTNHGPAELLYWD